MKSDELRVLLNLVMVSDPWPLSDHELAIMQSFLDVESRAAGYSDWIAAYHELPEVAGAVGGAK